MFKGFQHSAFLERTPLQFTIEAPSVHSFGICSERLFEELHCLEDYTWRDAFGNTFESMEDFGQKA
jgi:hypothetical protein